MRGRTDKKVRGVCRAAQITLLATPVFPHSLAVRMRQVPKGFCRRNVYVCTILVLYIYMCVCMCVCVYRQLLHAGYVSGIQCPENRLRT